ncbi:hypothetical protein KY285_033005 [Solanum tuberosum]|nr:hypothetical protein KY285_033005 [Solanum tuberosum]
MTQTKNSPTPAKFSKPSRLLHFSSSLLRDFSTNNTFVCDFPNLCSVEAQFHSDFRCKYANGITSVEKINIDVDELHIMLFHKIALELGVENVETFGCRVNKKVEEQAPPPRVEEHSEYDSLYNVDENIDDLSDLDEEFLQARQSNIQEQVKENTDRVNLDEIPYGPVGIDAGFEDIYKERRGRFEGNLGGDDPYFDSSDPSSDISEDEGDPVENDEVVDPAPRKESTKIYFDPTAKKTFGHNKKGCPTLSSVNACPSAGCTPSSRRPTNASSSGVRPAAALASGGRPTSATSSDVRQLKTKTKNAKRVGYGLLFGSGGSVTERSGNTDRVLHSATLSSSTPTNIDLGYKPNGLRWKGRAAITQRQLREESYRSTNGTQGTPNTQSTQGTH